ncbi:YbhB/YbcL family Raf kinase inhibitor-like protein [Leuconostocaceae bacterium ESL0958]|nr:YbhB/YbcL family Raf kinase inhibitor-like protein [Leuconostocaceae bacterium ESL0958]
MEISVALTAGYLPDQYAKYAPESAQKQGFPVESFPFTVEDLPANTRYLSWAFVDFDSVPVAGFAWIHWLVGNVPVQGTQVAIPANFSRTAEDQVHGQNSLYSKYVPVDDPDLINHYIGPRAPDQDHDYTFVVLASSQPLDLQPGFFLNELRKEGLHNPAVLGKAAIDIKARV